MTATDTIDFLLAALTHENWFEYLPIVHDSYLDAGDWQAAEAARDMAEYQRRPTRAASNCYFWFPYNRLVLRSHYINYAMSQRIDEILGKGITWEITPQFTGFVAAWKEGLRP
jgi:hypothetical protein